jgi:hypothetical protein
VIEPSDQGKYQDTSLKLLRPKTVAFTVAIAIIAFGYDNRQVLFVCKLCRKSGAKSASGAVKSVPDVATLILATLT